MSFVDVFFRGLEKSPSRPFVTEVRGDRLDRTHGGKLLEMIGQARRALREAGVAPGDRVVLLANNSARWVAADLAMLAEGAIVVPMYARQAPKELAAMAKDAGAKVAVAGDAELAQSLVDAGFEGRVLELASLFSGEPVRAKPHSFADGDVVTLIYTSGTSGEPKGVMTTAGNVEHMLRVIDSRLTELMGRPGGRDRVFHYLPFCFAGSRFVLWSNLYRENGVMVSTDLNDLLRELKTAAPEWFLNVPALLERVRQGVEKKIAERGMPIRRLYEASLDAWRRQRAGEGSVADRLLVALARRVIFKAIRQGLGAELRCLICGSAPLGEETQAWFDELLDLPVYQVYGLTETTAIVSMDRPRAAMPGKVGVPIDGVRVRLGEDSELQISGPNVFAGYWGREAATKDAFTEDGWFRTGDQASVDERGRIAIIGRVKNILVPESGHNVAPEPIEQLLMDRVPGIAQAVVIGHGRPYLTAILTGGGDREAVARAIDAVNAELPHYKRIRSFHLTSELLTPESGLLTANQKLKRRAIEAHFAPAIDGMYA
ncbi:MAG: AMP-binding protein [Sandaracinaceae bacterium]|nr:AMP-binding protein [Sandaracinaceae bacterium]